MKPFKDFVKGANIYLYMHENNYLHPDILISVCGELPKEGQCKPTRKLPPPKIEPKARCGRLQPEDTKQLFCRVNKKKEKNAEIKCAVINE